MSAILLVTVYFFLFSASVIILLLLLFSTFSLDEGDQIDLRMVGLNI